MRLRDFRRNFLRALEAVLAVYPHARVRPDADRLLLLPSPTHVPRLPPRLSPSPSPAPGRRLPAFAAPESSDR